MHSRIPRYKSGLEALKERKNFCELKLENILNDFENLEELIILLKKYMSDDSLKPFSTELITKLENTPSSKTIKQAYLYIIYDRVKNLIDKYKSKLTLDFKTDISNSSICISADCGINLVAVYLDIFKDRPTLYSVVYDIEQLRSDCLNIEGNILNYSNKVYELEGNLSLEKNTLENMLKDPRNLIHCEEHIITRDKFESDIIITTPIMKQQNVINSIITEITNINNTVAELNIRRQEILNLISVLENYNLSDFELVRDLLERTLGLQERITKANSVPIIRNEENVIDNKIYTVGIGDYPLEYTRKIKRPNKGRI